MSVDLERYRKGVWCSGEAMSALGKGAIYATHFCIVRSYIATRNDGTREKDRELCRVMSMEGWEYVTVPTHRLYAVPSIPRMRTG